MSTCFKCGRATPPNVTECEACERAGMEDRIEEALHAMDRDGIRFRQIDFSKVVTPEDFRLIATLLFTQFSISSNHPHYESLKRFLKP